MNLLIIGGGISGVSAAKVALKGGHHVTLLESAPEPGGLMARIANCRVGFKAFLDEIVNHPHLSIIKGSSIASAQKKTNGYDVLLEDGNTIYADRIVIATGLSPYEAVEYKGKRVLTSLEYDALIDQKNGDLPSDFEKVAFVLCVGSRSQEYPLCSSVCCSYTIREIKWTLQRAKPQMTVFYNDLRLFGQEFFMEKIFREAGVSFIRANSRYFDEDEEGVTVRYFSGGALRIERFNYVVLSMALRPNPQLSSLSSLFGFSLNEHGFVQEKEPLTTDRESIYISGGALEPMNIKDAILTGFGAGFLALRGPDFPSEVVRNADLLYREAEPEIILPEGDFTSCLFYLGTDDINAEIFSEFISLKFVDLAMKLKKADKTVYVVTKNMAMPSYNELLYENARREGVIFIHLEEGETLLTAGGKIRISGPKGEMPIEVDKIISFDDYRPLFSDKEFLSLYRSEPQLRWSPTKWGRKRYHTGFIRHPRDPRWEPREMLGALGEILLDSEEERVLPEVDEERCSGCGSCKESCPHQAVELEIRERQIAIFGPQESTCVPIAHIKEDTCVGCGLCASTCPSNVISFETRH